MDRKLYKLPFPEGNPPQWVCPTCGKSVLRVKKGTFYSKETSDTRKGYRHDEWEPDWIQSVYSCLLECSNAQCKEVVANSGVGQYDMDFDYDEKGQPRENWIEYFQPKYFQPHLKLFSLPDNDDVPKDVIKEIERSFEMFFCNPPSALNRIRIALENLLTYLKVKRFQIKNGKKVPLSLHGRIKLTPDKYSDLEDQFSAIKWLGNAGSHDFGEVSKDDVMDGYELMGEVLEKIFDTKSKKIDKLTKQINKKKGPKGKKRSKKMKR